MTTSAAREVCLRTTRIVARIEDGIGWLTLNHPERRNALSLEMWQGLGDAVEAFSADQTVRVIVIHGAGGKSFAAGADISEFDSNRANAEQKRHYGEISARASLGLSQLDKPLIAMIDGFCIGGGLAIALTADIRIASTAATFGIPAAKLGLGYEYEGIAALARLIGPSYTKDLLFSARFLDSGEALRIGLINNEVAPQELEQTVRDYAARIVANAPLTIHAAKAAVRLYEQYTSGADSKPVARLVDHCFDSADYQEGRRAFMEKRKPKFIGQ
ncbi:MAG: enoyl-CoA hydratase [Burkholderiaceae bacterium]